MKLTQNELDKVIGDIVTDLAKSLGQTSEPLNKSEAKAAPKKALVPNNGNGGGPIKAGKLKKEEDDHPATDEEKDSDGKEEPKAPKKAAPEGGDDSAPEPAPEEEPAPEAAPEAQMGGEGEGAPMGDQQNPEDLVQFFGSLDHASLKMYWDAIKTVLMSRMDAPVGDGDADDMAPPAPDQQPQMESMEQPPMTPPEEQTEKSEEEPEEEMQKSEIEQIVRDVLKEALSKEIEPLKKNVDDISTVLSKTFVPAKQNAVTVGTLVKNEGPSVESMSREEIKAKLSNVIREPSLKKHERESITGYLLDGTGLDAIKHLIK